MAAVDEITRFIPEFYTIKDEDSFKKFKKMVEEIVWKTIVRLLEEKDIRNPEFAITSGEFVMEMLETMGAFVDTDVDA